MSLTSMYSSYLDYCQDSRAYVYFKSILSRMGLHMQAIGK